MAVRQAQQLWRIANALEAIHEDLQDIKRGS